MVAESFLFVPFQLSRREDFSDRYSREEEMLRAGWMSDRYDDHYGGRGSAGGASRSQLAGAGGYHNHYLLKYVSEHVNSDDTGKRQCFHYLLTEVGWKKGFPAGKGQGFCCPKNREVFYFRDIHLYIFSTGVGILAFRIEFNRADAREMSDVLYKLKKASDRVILPIAPGDSRVPGITGAFGGLGIPDVPSAIGGSGVSHAIGASGVQNVQSASNGHQVERKSFSILDLSLGITEEIRKNDAWEFFFYADQHNYRCNTLSLLEEGKDPDFRKDLYYLRNGYGWGFDYLEDPETDGKEVFRTSADRIWGVTSEGAACVAPYVSKRGKDFTEGRFFRNFNSHYLFMFILALHQKYVLYLFLTLISLQMNQRLEDMAKLEEYRENLYLFEKDFSFAVVTEVPQYQIVYEKLREAFNLEKMYEDVHEPLVSLGEMREKKRDAVTNRALNAISILAIFSALVDSFDLIREIVFGDGLEPVRQVPFWTAWVILFADIAIILILFVRKVMVPLKKDKEDDRK